MNHERHTIRSKPRTLMVAITAGLWGAAMAAPAALADTPTMDPYQQPNNSWISISGSVDSVQRDSFMLDYGDGTVRVEMDDGDRDADAYKLLKGDKVVVAGRVDDDLFETTKIEAGSVYVENLGTTFFSSAVDEEDYEWFDPSMAPPVVVSRTVIRGTVTDVNDHEFLVDTGERTMRVETAGMGFDPLDDEGYLKIDEGDRVKVIGRIDVDFFEGRELEADTIVELYGGSS